MNNTILEQYNLSFAKIYFNNKYQYECHGVGNTLGMALYLSLLGKNIEEINVGLDKVTFFINGNTGDQELIDEMESHHFNMFWADFDYQNAYISDEAVEEYIQTLPLNDFKEILLLWKQFIQT